MTHWQQPSRIDRLGDARRDEAGVDALARDERARLMLFTRDGIPDLTDDGRPRVHELVESERDDLLLGRADGTIWWARVVVSVSGRSARLLDLGPTESELVMMAIALIEWHTTRPTCRQCGSDTVPAGGGAWRVCTGCRAPIFPRQDPAVIVAVTDPDDRLLLAHAVAWQRGRVSVLAGFVEAGESAEQACHREIAEEVGARLAEVTFAGSQPWPFPRSLMLGFTARAADARLEVDGVEIGWARYFSRADLDAALATGEVTLPGPASIARHLIDSWHGHPAGTVPLAGNPHPHAGSATSM